jgi:hypothetical protein
LSGVHRFFNGGPPLSHFPWQLPAGDDCLKAVDVTLAAGWTYHSAMPHTKLPQAIVIVAVPGELHYSVVNRDNYETLLHSEDYDSVSNRNRAARELKKLTGWPVVDHA